MFVGSSKLNADVGSVPLPADYNAWGKWLFYEDRRRIGTYATETAIRLYFRNHSQTVSLINILKNSRFLTTADVPGWVDGFDADDHGQVLFHGVKLSEDQREVAR